MSITLPELNAVSKSLGVLLGTDLAFSAGAPVDLAGAGDGAYVSYLTDDVGAVVGAIMADLPAALYLGGTLIMLPAGSLSEQLRSGEASEAALDGLSEVFNTLRSAVNHIPGNPHVCTTNVIPLGESTASDEGEWLSSAADRMDLVADLPLGEGRLTFLVR